MRLTRLELRSSPGLRRGFRLEDLSSGMNVIVGPNGSGKTSLVRAVRALLWDEEPFRGDVRGALEHEGVLFDIARESGLDARWVAEAPEAGRPELPDARFRKCFSLSVDDFLLDEATGEEIAGEMHRELSAGFDLREVMARERALSPLRAVSRATTLRRAQEDVQQVQEQHRALLVEERELAELEERHAGVKRARDLEGLLEDAIALAEARERLAEEHAILEQFPAGMDELRGDESRRLKELRAAIETQRDALVRARAEVAEAQERIAEARLEEPIAPERLEAFNTREERLRKLDRGLDEATERESVAAGKLGVAQRAMFALTGGEAPAEAGRERWDALELELRERDAARTKLDEARARVELASEDAPVGGGDDELRRWRIAAIAAMVLGALLALTVAPPLWILVGAGAAVLFLRGRGGEGEDQYRRRRAEERVRQLEVAERHVAKLEDELRARCGQLGLTAELATLTLQELIDRVRERAQAEAEFAVAQAMRHKSVTDRALELAEIEADMAELGMPAVRDVVDLRRAKDELARRDTALRNARVGLRAASARVEAATSALEAGKDALERFFADTGLDSDAVHELDQRLQRLDEFDEHRDAAGDLERDVRRLERRLAQHPELARLEPSGARARLSESRATLEGASEVLSEIARIQEQVRGAREGHDLEQALAAEQLAREALEEVRDELLEGAAAEFLLDSVQAEYRQHAQPDILRRASAWFARFTNQAYELLPPLTSDEEEQSFSVREAGGGTKLVGELSSGTLSQLQLALRLAVAQSLEKDGELPLLLDEALTNADPLRFREVARSLGALVAAGRQVFFLTADPDDALRLEQALEEDGVSETRHYDLGELRGEAAAAPSLARTPLPEVPAPAPGEEPEAYGERLLVPALDPFLGVDAMHLYYAFSHDLAGLHALLAERVESVGQARQLLAGDGPAVLTDAQLARFEATRVVTAAWFDAYKIGRGQRVEAALLREGPLKSTKFLDDVVDINEELGGDARALFEELARDAADRDPRLKGFRKAKLEALAIDLEQRGCYSPEEPLGPEALRERALTAANPSLAREVLRREDVFQLANSLAQWLELA